ncbi:hypothetical protein GXW83_22920 [Streptacidiphilus sp. PB12-B1b]|uniref:hypothetical protein n=1 Tax=Streptacidiphilus sp. PB12-B1b TaxID=2705012 RepID=UPI0015F9A4F4|nr:hypothetical protein [Streptacidiphilus sp. PB12-B1b]QMU78126.1 hypothetical protein GXW83_22920 [Streptacidiphilus sp. PB12-B1b]
MNGTVLPRDLWRAELIARSCLEPLLADRYRADPRGVLAELGVVLEAGEQPFALTEGAAADLLIEDLDRSSAVLGWCQVTIADDAPAAVRLEEQLVHA